MNELRLQEIAASGWRARTIEERSPWLLRSDSGLTGRANSALPLTSDTERLVAALPNVHDFYGSRDLPVRLQIPLDGSSLDEALAGLGFAAENRTCVLISRIPNPADDGTDGRPAVNISPGCSLEWLDSCEGLARPHGHTGRALVAHHPRSGFAEIRGSRGDIVAVGRVVVDEGWPVSRHPPSGRTAGGKGSAWP